MKVTKEEVIYRPYPYQWKATIPRGTPVVMAANLPGESYWVEPWDDMTKHEESWHRTYGFHLMPDEVMEV